MIIHVANPIYDSVFKYIMEDERIAKTMLSALLKKEVVHVTVRPHEYAIQHETRCLCFALTLLLQYVSAKAMR